MAWLPQGNDNITNRGQILMQPHWKLIANHQHCRLISNQEHEGLQLETLTS